jgi:hypothetical protein
VARGAARPATARAARRTIVEDRPVVIGIALLLLFAVVALWRSCVL